MEVFISQLLNLQEKLFRSALFMTQDKTKAKDLLQETFLRILENKDKFRQNNNLSGWANKIMSNIFISDYRKFSHPKEIFRSYYNGQRYCLSLRTRFHDSPFYF